MIWHNVRYAAGYCETLIGCDRRHLATSELEQIGRYFWNLVFETPIKNRIDVANASQTTLPNPRKMVELLPMATSSQSIDSAASRNGGAG